MNEDVDPTGPFDAPQSERNPVAQPGIGNQAKPIDEVSSRAFPFTTSDPLPGAHHRKQSHVIGPDRPSSATVHADRLEVSRGAVGVQVRVERQGTQLRSTVPSTIGEPTFTGRDAELSAIEDKLRTGRVVVLRGAPGLGKTRLAKEYARRNIGAYPGKMFFVPFEQPPPTELAKLLRDADRPIYSDDSIEDQCRRALHAVGSAGRALLIYDAIADERTLNDWLPYEGLDWHLIVTSTSAIWARSWSVVDVGSLRPSAELDLVASIIGDDAAARLATRIAARAAGVTIELCASAAAVNARLQRGKTVENLEADLAIETRSSFDSAWVLLSTEAQLMLRVASSFVTPRVPVWLITSVLQRIGWSPGAVDNAIDDARDRKLAAGDKENVEVHQLVAQYVRARASLVESVRRPLLDELLAAARAFSDHPEDLGRRSVLLLHSLNPEDWSVVAKDSEWQVVGYAVAELGRFEEARRWFERAVAVLESGNERGRVDAEALGKALNGLAIATPVWGTSRRRCRGVSARSPSWKRAMCADTWTQQALDRACTWWATATRAWASSRRRCHGTSARSNAQEKGHADRLISSIRWQNANRTRSGRLPAVPCSQAGGGHR